MITLRRNGLGAQQGVAIMIYACYRELRSVGGLRLRLRVLVNVLNRGQEPAFRTTTIQVLFPQSVPPDPHSLVLPSTTHPLAIRRPVHRKDFILMAR